MPDEALPARPSLRHRIGPAGLGTVLAGLLAVSVLLLALLAVALLGWRTAAELKHSIGLGLQQRASDSADLLDAAMFERYREVQLLARRAGATAGQHSLAQRRRELEELQRTYPLYAWMGVADTSGKVIAATGGVLEGADVSQQPWWAEAPSGVYVHDVHSDPLLGRWLPANSGRALRVLDLAFPLRRRQPPGRRAGRGFDRLGGA